MFWEAQGENTMWRVPQIGLDIKWSRYDDARVRERIVDVSVVCRAVGRRVGGGELKERIGCMLGSEGDAKHLAKSGNVHPHILSAIANRC